MRVVVTGESKLGTVRSAQLNKQSVALTVGIVVPLVLTRKELPQSPKYPYIPERTCNKVEPLLGAVKLNALPVVVCAMNAVGISVPVICTLSMYQLSLIHI